VSRALLILNDKAARERACHWAMRAPLGTRLEFKATKRSVPQNAKFWAMLTDIASQLAWHGQRLTPEDWRLMFLDALTREVRFVPNIDGTGFVPLRRSSDLSKEEMSDVIELIHKFGAEHGVVFHDSEGRTI
jgi:hypothetical protein